jgi:predicted  nucleic acid-binding Zn-ribbon protein
VRTYSEQIAKAMDENRQYINDLEQAKRKFVDTEKELANSKLSLQSARKELKKQRSKIMDVEVELEKER